MAALPKLEAFRPALGRARRIAPLMLVHSASIPSAHNPGRPTLVMHWSVSPDGGLAANWLAEAPTPRKPVDN